MNENNKHDSSDGIILDPFCGDQTVSAFALRGRQYVGIDIFETEKKADSTSEEEENE